MDKFLIICMLGIAVGVVDTLPMVKMKLDKYSITSAFVFHFTLPFIMLNTELFYVVWRIKRGLTGGILVLPMTIIVSREDKRPGLPTLTMSTMLGEVTAILAHPFSLQIYLLYKYSRIAVNMHSVRKFHNSNEFGKATVSVKY